MSQIFHIFVPNIAKSKSKTGIINIFCKHTSCGLSINENADPDVRVNMGTWQGIYFCEYRNYGGSRRLVVTIIGE